MNHAVTSIHWRALITGGLVLGLVAAACGNSSPSGSAPSSGSLGVSSSHTLDLAFGADMQVPDPDIFYEIEGNAVVTSVYEGLVKYADGSTKIIPALAQSWEVAPDGKTYTFHLVPGVTFHDGTSVNSQAAAFSFARRTGVNSAPAYMLANVVSTETPDPQTFIVHLNQPVSAFMDYLASPYGPKMASPTTVKAHEVGVTSSNPNGDWAQEYLKTHDAGTGPYSITQFVPGSHYVLSAYNNYWGTKPYYTTVNIDIVPDISVQQAELQNGKLSMILHGLPVNAVQSFKSGADFQVHEFPAQLKAMLYVNPTLGIFKSQTVRSALRQAIDKAAIVASVYGNTLATVSTQAYPVDEFPPGTARDNPTYDPTALKNALKGANGPTSINLSYSTDDPTNQRVAEFIQTELDADGLSVQVHGVPISQVFNYASTPPDQLPNLLVWTVNPDDSHPDSWIRIFSNTNGSLNELHGSVPQADALMDAGLHSTDPTTIQSDYAQAGALVAESGEWISIADVRDVVVSHAGVGGWYFQLPTADTVVLGDLTYTGKG
ncbi:MAG TPA: ABC transporter substrate-binding protein [Acidimicrobiales bacterium]